MANRHRTKGNVAGEGPDRADGAGAAGLRHHGRDLGANGFSQHVLTGAVAARRGSGSGGQRLEWRPFVAVGLVGLLGAPTHWSAKGISLIVGISLDGPLPDRACQWRRRTRHLAANGLTELVWGAAGALVIVLRCCRASAAKPTRSRALRTYRNHAARRARAQSRSDATRAASGQRASIDRHRRLPARARAVPSLPFGHEQRRYETTVDSR